MSKITALFKRPSSSMTNATDNDNISPENAEPPNKKASKLLVGFLLFLVKKILLAKLCWWTKKLSSSPERRALTEHPKYFMVNSKEKVRQVKFRYLKSYLT